MATPVSAAEATTAPSAGEGAPEKKNGDKEEGEIPAEEEEDEDPFYCDVCDVRFEASKVGLRIYIYGVWFGWPNNEYIYVAFTRARANHYAFVKSTIN